MNEAKKRETVQRLLAMIVGIKCLGSLKQRGLVTGGVKWVDVVVQQLVGRKVNCVAWWEWG